MVKLSSDNVETILKAHNIDRNLLASGKVPGFKSATKMNVLKWDPELAALAEFNVKQCEIKHDKCRATEKYPRAGQNLFWKASTGSFKDVNSVLNAAVKSWFDEYKLASQSNIDTCCGGGKLKKIGHFLQMAQDKAVAVGCAVSKYTNGKWKTTLVACNYSYGNILQNHVYTTGRAASDCPKGTSSEYTSLCN
ncbi:venom allergen-1-like [Chironomus tepperi]|uniref:venom allergen-1-like n=1 Tax=Chironomus tepperi TaxID=113505 RepID=UPI00391F11C4